MTFGVQPERAATEYGYISPGGMISGDVPAVEKFVEKPDPATAVDYVKSGYLWNSGNFMFRATVLSTNTARSMPKVLAVSEAVAKAGSDLGFVTFDPESLLDRRSRSRSIMP